MILCRNFQSSDVPPGGASIATAVLEPLFGSKSICDVCKCKPGDVADPYIIWICTDMCVFHQGFGPVIERLFLAVGGAVRGQGNTAL